MKQRNNEPPKAGATANQSAPAGCDEKHLLVSDEQGKAVVAIKTETEKIADERYVACELLNPTTLNAITIGDLATKDPGVQAELINALQTQIKAVADGDISQLEGLLVAQANTLNVMFWNMVTRSEKVVADFPEAHERFMRLGLKAQAQCRATVETIADMKNPPVVFARNANVVGGNQQVNVGVSDARGKTECLSADQPEASLAISDGSSISGTEMPGQDPFRQPVPVLVNAERPLPHARRNGTRRPKGEQECVEARREVG